MGLKLLGLKLFHGLVLECTIYFGAPLVYAFARGGDTVRVVVGFCGWITLVALIRAFQSLRRQRRAQEALALILQREDEAAIAWEPDWDARWGELPADFSELDGGRQIDAMDQIRINDLFDREKALLAMLTPDRLAEARAAVSEMLAAQRSHIRTRLLSRAGERVMRQLNEAMRDR